MNQLTIRGFGDDLERRLHEVAGQEGTSLNKAALKLLRRGAGLEAPGPESDVLGRSLDMFIGTWSADQEKELLDSIQVFDQLDRSFWK